MIRAIHEYDSLPFLFVAKNIPRLEFVNLMRRASCLLGNSSAGILEAPLLKLPVINVGNRQRGRMHAENVQFAEFAKFPLSWTDVWRLDHQNAIRFACPMIGAYGSSESA